MQYIMLGYVWGEGIRDNKENNVNICKSGMQREEIVVNHHVPAPTEIHCPFDSSHPIRACDFRGSIIIILVQFVSMLQEHIKIATKSIRFALLSAVSFRCNLWTI